MADDKSAAREALEAQADLLGVDYPWNLGDDKLAERVEARAEELRAALVGRGEDPEAVAAMDVKALAQAAEDGAPDDEAGIIVTGPKKGRWRAGRHFTKEPRIIPLKNMTDAEVAAIKDDPALTVEDRVTETAD